MCKGKSTWHSHVGCGVSFELSWWARFHGRAKTYADWVWYSSKIGELCRLWHSTYHQTEIENFSTPNTRSCDRNYKKFQPCQSLFDEFNSLARSMTSTIVVERVRGGQKQIFALIYCFPPAIMYCWMLNKLRGRWIIVLVTQRNLLPTKNSLPVTAQKKTELWKNNKWLRHKFSFPVEDQRMSGNTSFRIFSGHSNIRLYK